MSPRKRKSDAYVEAVLEDRPLPHGRLDDPEDVAAVRAAIELRAATPLADTPDDAFIAGLGARLSEAVSGGAPVPVPEATAGARRAGPSRRAFLAGAAAAALAGAGGVVLDRTEFAPTGPSQAQAELAPHQGTWVAVAAEADLGATAQAFTTGTVAGFVSDQAGAPVAVSGVCTHLGCLLAINAAAGRLDCPCHQTAFSFDGTVISYELPARPPPLPRIQARRQNGSIEVLVPPPP